MAEAKINCTNASAKENRHFWFVTSSFWKYLRTPYITVPKTNKNTVGVKDGYRNFTKNLSHSSGRKPVEKKEQKVTN